MDDPLKKYWIVAFVLIVIALAACQQTQPTPTVPAQVAKLPEVPLQAIETTMLTLLRNPVAFEGQLVRLTGEYRPLPIAICSDVLHRSPASWSLVDGEAETLAAGFDAMLRELAQPGMALVVEGQWQQWEGPVGCGRRAPVSQIWYLDVTNIVSPNPLVITTPEGELVAEAISSPSPTAIVDQETEGTSEETLASPVTTATSTTRATLTTTVAASATPSSTPSPEVTGTSLSQGSATVTATPSITGTPATLTPTSQSTGTSQAGTPTATATGGAASTVSPTPSPTASSAEVLDFDDIVVENMAAREAKSWRFTADMGDRITVSVGPVPGLDISLELLDPNGQSLNSANQGGNGIAESIGDIDLTADGDYQVIVRSMSGSGEYSLVLLTDDSLPFMVHQGTMIYGQNNTRSVAQDIDDLWHFLGTIGDVVTIRADANGPEDIVLYLTGPDGVELDFADADIDHGPPDDFEEISQFSLPLTGLYVIGVGESDFLAFSYTLTLNK